MPWTSTRSPALTPPWATTAFQAVSAAQGLGTGDLLDRFLAEVAGLGPKLGPLLVQLPPGLAFHAGVADRFLAEIRTTLGDDETAVKGAQP